MTTTMTFMIWSFRFQLIGCPAVALLYSKIYILLNIFPLINSNFQSYKSWKMCDDFPRFSRTTYFCCCCCCCGAVQFHTHTHNEHSTSHSALHTHTPHTTRTHFSNLGYRRRCWSGGDQHFCRPILHVFIHNLLWGGGEWGCSAHKKNVPPIGSH